MENSRDKPLRIVKERQPGRQRSMRPPDAICDDLGIRTDSTCATRWSVGR